MRERTFGLVRSDGSEKPACTVIRAFAARLARGDVHFGVAPKLLDVNVDAYYASPTDHFARLYARWLAGTGAPVSGSP